VRRHQEIPNDRGERGGVAELHCCHVAEATSEPKGWRQHPFRVSSFLTGSRDEA
jgi:hypothetical protein